MITRFLLHWLAGKIASPQQPAEHLSILPNNSCHFLYPVCPEAVLGVALISNPHDKPQARLYCSHFADKKIAAQSDLLKAIHKSVVRMEPGLG